MTHSLFPATEQALATAERMSDNARMSNKALEIAVEALLAIGLHRESLEGRRAIEAMRKIRNIMRDEGDDA